MTEEEWLSCSAPFTMLEFLQALGASDRKLRLFAVACCRTGWAWLAEGEKPAVLAAEEFAEGRGRLPDTHPSRHSSLVRAACHSHPLMAAARAALYTSASQATEMCGYAPVAEAGQWRSAEAAASAELAGVLRCIFGNPFRPIPRDGSWRTSTAVALARQMYESRDCSAMPILGDALEDGGCADERVLNHCRGPGVHVRGCHVVDLVLDLS